MKPGRTYRFADAWIGAFLGALLGGSLAVVILYLNFDPLLSPMYFVLAMISTGATVCGSLAYYYGQRFTHALEALIQRLWNFFGDDSH